MNKENTFLKIITYGPLIFIPFIVGVILFIFIQTYNDSFQQSIDEVEKDLYNLEKQTLKAKVTSVVNLITYRKSIIKDTLTSRVKDRVEKAFLQAQNIYIANKDTHTELEIKQMIRNALRPLIWNNGESFIWIVDYDGIFNLAPSYLKHLEGSSIINFQDAKGRYVIQEEIEICKEKGNGFLWDTFTKPNDPSKKQYEQVAYVKSFGHYNWYLGSGEYLDTATKKTDKNLLKTIAKVDPIHDQYLFLLNDKGSVFITKTKLDIIGKNVSEMKDKEAVEAINRVINSLKDKSTASLNYTMVNPDTKKSEVKYSYVSKVPNSDWIIGSGFYMSDIQNKLSKKRVDMYEVFYGKSKNIIYIAILLTLLSLIVSYYISRRLKMSFNQYKESLSSKNIELQEFNNTLELKVEKRTLELEKMKDEFEKLATTDMLTQMNNRYSIMKLLSIEISRSHRYNTPMSLILFDIDMFKKVNDEQGHDVGDDVLSHLSTVVKNNLRDIDNVGRYGGEEFIVILPSTDLENAKVFADRLRKAVEEHLFDTVGSITISLGLVELQANETVDKLFKRADELLYKSKDNGRNQVSY